MDDFKNFIFHPQDTIVASLRTTECPPTEHVMIAAAAITIYLLGSAIKMKGKSKNKGRFGGLTLVSIVAGMAIALGQPGMDVFQHWLLCSCAISCIIFIVLGSLLMVLENIALFGVLVLRVIEFALFWVVVFTLHSVATQSGDTDDWREWGKTAAKNFTDNLSSKDWREWGHMLANVLGKES